MERKKLPYGIPNFRKVALEGYLFVDKTQFAEEIESLGEPYLFFLRPRKFGKSLFVSLLEHYYDINHADIFESLFRDFYIGKHPTPLHNSYLVLLFDFSGINTETKETTYKGFLDNVKYGIRQFMGNYAELLNEVDLSNALDAESPEIALRSLLGVVNQRTDKRIYLLVDEYDHFANELLAFRLDMFKEVISGTGFVRKFYEVIKTGTRDGIIDRIFITGVTPITLDSFTSGFNIGKNLSLHPKFHDMLGFTEKETYNLVEMICAEHGGNPEEVFPEIIEYYNGYKFSSELENSRLFNPDMVLYNLEREFERDDLISLMFYTGFITIERRRGNRYVFRMPNYVIGELYYKYFYELLEKRYSVRVRRTELNDAIEAMAYDGQIDKFVKVVEEFLTKVMSNRDFRGFREGHLKIHILTLLFLNGLYYIQSELEAERGYVDIFLRELPQFPVDYEWVLELKYVRKEDAEAIEQVKNDGMEQLKRYTEKVRPQTHRVLKGALLIFSGEGDCVDYLL